MDNLKPDEILRTCNKCDHKWYSSISREKDLSARSGGNSLSQILDIAVSDFQASSQRSRNIDALESELAALKRCPKCGSYDYQEITADDEKFTEINFNAENDNISIMIAFVLIFIIPIFSVFILKVEENISNFILMIVAWFILLFINIWISSYFEDSFSKFMNKIQNNNLDDISKKTFIMNINFEHPSKAFTPLFLAIYHNLYNMAKLLIEKGADVNKKISKGIAPLGLAIDMQNNNIVKLLVKHGANVNIPADHNNTLPLIMAISKKAPDIFWTLLENGADFNVVTEPNKYSPLHYAVEENNISFVRLLLSRNADITIKEKTGKTPLDLAIIKNNVEIIELLKAKETEVQNAKKAVGNRRLIIKTQSEKAETVPEAINDDSKECPYCAEIIKKKAVLCKYCKSALEV